MRAPQDDVASDLPERIVFLDGVCVMCHGIAQRVIKIDKQRKFRFSTLQGETAARFRAQLSDFPTDLNTMVYAEKGTLHFRAQAVLVAAQHTPWPYKGLWYFRWLPAVLVNPFYNLVAKLRYRLFGKLEACPIPTPEQRELFLP